MKKILNYDGQEASWDTEEKILYVNIKEPFYSAGKIYGWEGNPMGVGINKGFVELAVNYGGTIRFTVDNHPIVYNIDAIRFKKFVTQHNSIWIKNKTQLYIHPLRQKQNNIISFQQTKLI